jgi:hypothetical protein
VSDADDRGIGRAVQGDQAALEGAARKATTAEAFVRNHVAELDLTMALAVRSSIAEIGKDSLAAAP